jgi:hypothetical protein
VEQALELMDAATATLYGAAIAGVFTLLGVLIERLLRLTGALWFEASELSLEFFGATDPWDAKGVAWELANETTPAEEAEYRFAIDLFNGKEVPTGLRDIKVVLVRKGGEPLTSQPVDSTSARITDKFSGPTYSAVKVLNIPPHQFVRKELRGSFDKEAAETIRDGKWRSIDFVGEFPSRPILGILGSKTYRKTITKHQAATEEPEPRSWWQRWFGG